MIHIGNRINDRMIDLHINFIKKHIELQDINNIIITNSNFTQKTGITVRCGYCDTLIKQYNDIVYKILYDLGIHNLVSFTPTDNNILSKPNFIKASPLEMIVIYRFLYPYFNAFVRDERNDANKKTRNIFYKCLIDLLGYSKLGQRSFKKSELFEFLLSDQYIKNLNHQNVDTTVEKILKKSSYLRASDEFTEGFKKDYTNFIKQLKNLDGSSEEKFIECKKIIVSFTKKLRMSMTNNDELYSYENTPWGSYKFIKMLGVNICPYCNINYTPTVIKPWTGKGTRADLDHFLPKDCFPYFSMSIYNLVPSCKICNSSFKGDKREFLYGLNPHYSGYEDVYKFVYDFDDVDSILDIDNDINSVFYNLTLDEKYIQKNDIDKINVIESAKVNIDNLSTILLYDQFIDETIDFLTKYKKYNNSSVNFINNIIEDITSINQQSVVDIKEKRYWLGVVDSKYDFVNSSLSKLRYDLFEDLQNYENSK